MPRAIWSGSISFGLVNVPVKLYSAISPKDVRFHQLEEGTNARIRQKRISSETGEEVPYERIVKGYEIAPDHYVLITPEDLEALDPKATRTIDIEDFVELDQIDPIHYKRAYYLVPERGANRHGGRREGAHQGGRDEGPGRQARKQGQHRGLLANAPRRRRHPRHLRVPRSPTPAWWRRRSR